MLGKEATVKKLQPLQDLCFRIVLSKSPAGQVENLTRSKLVANNLEQEEIVQFVRSDLILGFLADVTIRIGWQQFRRNRRGTNIMQNLCGLAAELGLGGGDARK